jgi:hypothetical protein
LLEPYNLDIEDLEESKMICLLTGRLLSPNRFHQGTKLVGLLDYIDNKWNGGPIFVLHLTGSEATRVVFVSMEFNMFIRPEPIWVDKHGMSDVGLKSGRYLMLDRNALDAIFDEFLSGKYHDLVRQQ